MYGLIKKWGVGGPNKNAFCLNHGISRSKFFLLAPQMEEQKEAAPDGFVAITPVKDDVFQAQYRLTYPNGVQLKFSGIGLGHLSALVNL